MREIGIDIETYSSEDLAACGVYRYAEAPDFEILLFGYCVDGGAVRCVDLARGESIPADVIAALTDPAVIKTAYNATFERVCLSRYLGVDGYLDPSSWRCTMTAAARWGLPLPLGQCAEVLGLPEGKMTEGRRLIQLFSKPTRGRRTMPGDAPDKWETFKAYNVRDVEVEQAILAKVRNLEVPAAELELYIADQEINDRGVMIDRRLVENAAAFDADYKARILQEARDITGMENPNSPAQIKAYIRGLTHLEISSLSKGNIDELYEDLRFWPQAQRVVEIRRELGKTSNKKYDAMLGCVCRDGRVRGLMQFYGAARTGRWAGRLVQVQNLPQNHIADIDNARSIVRRGDLDELEDSYDNPMQILSELIRTSFTASPGRTLHVCDFSAIEARVVAWVSREEWVLDVFRRGGDIYCATASQMFGVPVEKHGANAHLRQKGKISVLALGYGGGVPALEAMGGKRLGLTEDEERVIVRKWRDANANIVKFWSRIERACLDAIRGRCRVPFGRCMAAEYRRGVLMIELPSGRRLCYPRARITVETFDDRRGDKEGIEYESVNQTTRKWGTTRTYGGKLTENVVQAIARDILGEVLIRARRAGMDVVFHVHDEIIVDALAAVTLDAVAALFDTPPEWCPGLPLKGAGYTTPYYLKD